MTSGPETKQRKKNAGHSDQTRPSASPGFWLCMLLPTALVANLWTYSNSVSFEYELSSLVSVGLLLQSLVIVARIQTNRKLTVVRALPAALTSSLIYLLLKQSFWFSALVATASKFTFHGIFFYMLKYLPKSFTYGEAFIVSQGVSLFLLNVFLKFSSVFDYEPYTDMEKMTTILQVGLFGVAFLVGCCHFVPYFRGIAFYALLAIVGFVIVLFPIGDNVAAILLLEFILADMRRLLIITLYFGLLIVTVIAVIWHISRNQSSNTRVRKIFHVLVVLVFAPGLICECTFLFIASGVALALMILLETMRVIELWPVSDVLQSAVKGFIDEKDAGVVAVTPIYLLVGCAMPIWLHPNPCEYSEDKILPLLSGVLSVGIGDTAASIFGSKFGRFKWPGHEKTVEGTLAAILAQTAILPLLVLFDWVPFRASVVAIYFATILVNSFVETFTDQVDNLVLPLVTFILFTLGQNVE